MSTISLANCEKIKSALLCILFDESPKPISAAQIASQEARDKEFILKLLKSMEKKQLVKNVTPAFSRKSYWVMTDEAYRKYKELLR